MNGSRPHAPNSDAAGNTGMSQRVIPALHSFDYSLSFFRELIADLNAQEMVTQPPGILNHPAWVLGHLTFTCQMLGGAVAGLPAWLPDEWGARFGSGSVPVSNVAAYEASATSVARLADAQARITEAVMLLDDLRLDEAFPDPAYLDVFPTVQHALTQVLVGHTAYHVGQIAVWRKAIGKSPVRRSYE